MVGDAQLEAACGSRSKRIVRGVRIAVDGLHHHRDGGTVTRIVEELGDRGAHVIENDVVVAGDASGSEGDVTTRTLTEHGHLVATDAVRVAVVLGALAEETHRGAAVLDTAVSGLNQLKRALGLGCCSRVPTEAVVDAGHHISFLGELRADGHGARVVAVAHGAAVHVLRQEVSCVEVENERAIGLRVTGRLVNVAKEILRCRRHALQGRNDGHVVAIHHAFGHVDVAEHLIDVADTLAVDLAFGQGTEREAHAGGVVIHDLVNPEHGLSLTHGRVQRELGGENVGLVGVVVGLDSRFAEPLPRGAVEGLGWSAIHVAVEDREETVPTVVRGRCRILDVGVGEDGVVVGGVAVDLLVNVISTAHFHHGLVRRWNDEHCGLIRSVGVVWRLEADHRQVSLVEPVQVTQCTTKVHLEVKVGAVPHVVGHAQLEASRRSWSVGVGRGIRVAMNGLDDHGDGGAVTWIVEELGDGRTHVIKNDVVVAGDACGGEGDVAPRAFTDHTDFVGVDAIRVAVLSHRLAEVSDGRAAVLNTAVCRLDELQCALGLGRSGRIPTEAVVDTGHHIAHFGVAGADLDGTAVGFGSLRSTVDVRGQEVSGVEVQQQRTVGLGVTGGFVEVEHQRLWRGRQALQRGDDSDVGSVLNVGGDGDIAEHLVEVSGLCTGSQADGESRQQETGLLHDLVPRVEGTR